MKLIRTTAGVSLTIVTALLLAGCSTTSAETAEVSNGNATTDWREGTNQKPLNPEDGGYVDHTDTSRQDGAKEIKFITENVERTDPITGKTKKFDETTVLNVTASTVTALGPIASSNVYGLKLNDKGTLQPQKFDEIDLETYSITLTADYVSGWDGLTGHESGVPLFWPITENGVTGYVLSSNASTPLSKTSSTFNLTVAVKAGSAAPIGARYLEFDVRNTQLLAPAIDVFTQEGAVVTPRDEATAEPTN